MVKREEAPLMSVIAKSVIAVAIALGSYSNPGSCLEEGALVEQDAHWERSVLEGDVEYLEEHLADEFVWVHDHASAIDSKEGLLGWVGGYREDAGMRSRVQSDVETRRLGSTAIVMGYTVVTREDGSTRYRFMRTYGEVSGECFLLGNQTMVVPDS
jgi:hypothetical protein